MPRIGFRDLWRFTGTVDRGPYALVGLIGVAIKHNLDRVIASALGRPWGIFNYWIPFEGTSSITRLSDDERRLLVWLLLASLPFVWVGVALTLRRLRSAALPPWLVALFFVPVVNVVFFLVLCLLPARRPDASPAGPPRAALPLGRLVPDDPLGSAAVAAGLAVVGGLAGTWLSANVFSTYGLGLFVALPFCMGLVAALVHGHHRPQPAVSCLIVAGLSLLVVSAALLALALEGVMCIAMAGPIATPLTLLGAWVGYLIQRRGDTGETSATVVPMLLLAAPLLAGAEALSPAEPPVFEVTSAIEIDAPPGAVWRHLVAFPAIAPPREWLFRVGIAYPISASIEGQGLGARRTCTFSTGEFVEPILAWEEARRLAFRISAQPPVMEEWTPYAGIQPPHVALHYLRPEDAEFTLTPLANGGTRLEGRSRYRNAMWPSAYWRLFSDTVVRSVHRRVFEHIRTLAEGD